MRLLLLLAICAIAAVPVRASDLFARENLIAWCIVPFDAKKRGPEERAAMLERLGFKHFAYDYRAEHIPTWDGEIEALKRHGVELSAWWFRTKMDDEARATLELFKRHNVRPQLWVSGGGPMTKTPEEQQARIESEAARVRSIADAAAELGCKVGLYNHGGWFGEPENQIALIERLRRDSVANVGLVYNLHHGHEHLDRFPELLAKMKPHLLALNLNGMTRGGAKILPLGKGELDLQLLRTIRDSGWHGLVGILNHTGEDAEARLRANLDGLDALVRQLAPDAATFTIPAAKPDELTAANGWPAPETFRTWTRSLGGPTSNRFSALDQINKGNVAKLTVAWTYRSGDGKANVQCNPIVVGDTLYLPTAGRKIAALDAATGKERWKFDPRNEGKRLEDAPARRGLLFWPGDAQNPARIIFATGNWLHALDPATGQPLAGFGEKGRAHLPTGGTAVGAIFQQVLVVPGYLGDVFGYDVRDGRLLWTFKTKPDPGQPGAETWSKIEEGANCWGGMALDESRGAYVATGSPKPNFFGMGHQGDNLFSNCVLALDALTGRRPAIHRPARDRRRKTRRPRR